jgi:hypothetical protein
LPLAVLLSLQWRLLVNLQRNSAVAHRVALDAQLDVVARQIALHFSTSGERTLRVPPWFFTPPCDCFDQLVFDRIPPAGSPPDDPVARETWLTTAGRGVRYFLLAPMVGPFVGRVLVYDLQQRARIDAESIAPSTRLALSYLELRARKMPASVDAKDVIVDESDPGRPMLLAFVVDEQAQIVGITAMVLDLTSSSGRPCPRSFAAHSARRAAHPKSL